MTPLEAGFLPEFGKRNQFGDLEPATAEDVLAKANEYLRGLSEKGASIKAVVPVTVDVGKRGGIVGTVKEQKYLVITETP